MKLKPLQDRILVKRLEESDKKKISNLINKMPIKDIIKEIREKKKNINRRMSLWQSFMGNEWTVRVLWDVSMLTLSQGNRCRLCDQPFC